MKETVRYLSDSSAAVASPSDLNQVPESVRGLKFPLMHKGTFPALFPCRLMAVLSPGNMTRGQNKWPRRCEGGEVASSGDAGLPGASQNQRKVQRNLRSRRLFILMPVYKRLLPFIDHCPPGGDVV